MATGIPGINGVQRGTHGAYRLEYDGKTSESEILSTAPAQLEILFTSGTNWLQRVIYGENLRVLRALLDDANVAGKVRLIYIDPPYATRSRFESRSQRHAYDDDLSGSHYLEFLRQRLVLLREILADDGSIYVHLDDKMAFPVKVIMDEVFGSSNFRNIVTRKKCNPKNYTRKQYGNISDFILFYTKNDSYIWNQAVDGWTDETAAKEYQYIDEHGLRFKKVPIHAPGVRNGATGQEWRGMMPPPGKHWQYTPATLDAMDARGEIYWSPTGNPRRKVYLENSKGIPVQDIWMDFKDAHNQNILVTGYPTEKNPQMMRRIIEASSNPGDLVLDAFAGSGTTAALAGLLGRRWIAIDNSKLAIETMLRRLVYGSEPMGDFVNGKRLKAVTLPGFSEHYVHESRLAVFAEREGGELPQFELLDEWRAMQA